jgi:hypothetical protein
MLAGDRPSNWPSVRPTSSETRSPPAKARCSMARSRMPDDVRRSGASSSACTSVPILDRTPPAGTIMLGAAAQKAKA